jgi:methyl-accepting chemotaxis protein
MGGTGAGGEREDSMTILRRLRLAGRLGGAFLIVLVLLGAAVGVGAWGLTRQTESAQGLKDLQHLMHQVDEQKYYNGDISGWQIAYVWDTRRMPPAKAVDPESDNRAGFLADFELLKKLLEETNVSIMTDAERAEFEALRGLWDDFKSTDDQMVALYAAGRVDDGDAMLLKDSYAIYFKIIEATGKLVTSVVGRRPGRPIGAGGPGRGCVRAYHHDRGLPGVGGDRTAPHRGRDPQRHRTGRQARRRAARDGTR